MKFKRTNRSPYADTPLIEELRERHQPGKCIICYKPIKHAGGRGTRALTCVGECRSRFHYAHNRNVFECKSPEEQAKRNLQARLRREMRRIDPNEYNPMVPGLPCNLDPRRSMESDREFLADVELRGYVEDIEQGGASA